MNQMITKVMRDRWFETALKATCLTCAIGAILTLGFIILFALSKGFDKISIDFLSTPSRASGTDGGILYQILGTFILMFSAALIVTPFACGIAVLERTAKFRTLSNALRSVLHLLNATPSILFGILGFIFFVKYCSWDKSWLGGGFVLALMMLPTVTLSLINRIETIPNGYLETARSLGLTDDQLIGSILLPYGYGGLLTGLVMGLARAAGETAPIMFTAVVFAGATLPDGVVDNPVLAMPYHIFNLAQDILSDDALTSAWATAFFLILFVLLMSLMIAPFRARSHEEANR